MSGGDSGYKEGSAFSRFSMGSRPASERVDHIEGEGHDRTIEPASGVVSAGLVPSSRTPTKAMKSRFINWSAWSGLLFVIATGAGFWFLVALLIVKFVR
jgi:hypothetical protein